MPGQSCGGPLPLDVKRSCDDGHCVVFVTTRGVMFRRNLVKYHEEVHEVCMYVCMYVSRLCYCILYYNMACYVPFDGHLLYLARYRIRDSKVR